MLSDKSNPKNFRNNIKKSISIASAPATPPASASTYVTDPRFGTSGLFGGTAMATPGKCVLLTGPPGVGKTTLIMKVLESLKSSNPSLKVQGFYTREIRHGSERVGFEVVTVGGQIAPLASINASSPESIRWPHVGRYKVDVASFESVALPELQIKEETNLFVIDEVGKMELYSSSFLPAVLRILDSNIPVLASIPIPKQGRDVPGVARMRNHPRAVIYTLNQSNRDTLRERIYSQLTDLLYK